MTMWALSVPNLTEACKFLHDDKVRFGTPRPEVIRPKAPALDSQKIGNSDETR